MPTRIIMGLIVALAFTSCKTTDTGSAVAAWELDGNKQAAQDFIMNTVNQFYQDTQGQTTPLREFALALADQKTEQTESGAYVLQEYYERSQSGTLDGEASPLQQYIIQQFVIMTNYLAYHENPAGNPLQYVGSHVNDSFIARP